MTLGLLIDRDERYVDNDEKLMDETIIQRDRDREIDTEKYV